MHDWAGALPLSFLWLSTSARKLVQLERIISGHWLIEKCHQKCLYVYCTIKNSWQKMVLRKISSLMLKNSCRMDTCGFLSKKPCQYSIYTISLGSSYTQMCCENTVSTYTLYRWEVVKNRSFRPTPARSMWEPSDNLEKQKFIWNTWRLQPAE